MTLSRKDKLEVDKLLAPDPSGQQVIYWDHELRGFGVLISGKTDTKSYIVQRRFPNRRTVRRTIGLCAEFTRIEDARREAGKFLRKIRAGIDPNIERTARADNVHLRRRDKDILVARAVRELGLLRVNK